MNFLLDSSFIIEILKNNPKARKINEILENFNELNLFYNHIVFSEVVYQLVFKRKLNIDLVAEILNSFILLDLNRSVKDYSLSFIKNYGLKPNDALILATCKHYKIENLISLDKDFEKACQKEGIILINSPEKLK